MIDVNTLEIMITQLEEGDYSVFETVKNILEADLTPEENIKVNKLFTRVYNALEDEDINNIQMSLALYSINRAENIQKIYTWLNKRLEQIKTKEWTKEKFFKQWDKAYPNILDLMSSDETPHIDSLALSNVVAFVNKLREDGENAKNNKTN